MTLAGIICSFKQAYNDVKFWLRFFAVMFKLGIAPALNCVPVKVTSLALFAGNSTIVPLLSTPYSTQEKTKFHVTLLKKG